MKQGCHKRDILLLKRMAYEGKSVDEISRIMSIFPKGIEVHMPSEEEIKEEKAKIKKAKQKKAKEAKEVAKKATDKADELAKEAEDK